ncbi:MAG: replication-relaxation family protein [Mycobacteriales bacterium]
MPPQTSPTVPIPFRSSSGRGRLRLSDELVTGVARHLTDRDRYLCELLAEHRVLTTDQIACVGFASPISARHRLATLYRLRVLDRFRPFRPVGTAPNHWVLDAIGAMVVAAGRDIETEEFRWRRDKTLALAGSRQLAHRIGVNGFFTALLAETRHRQHAELRAWWPERRCAATWGEVVRPDSYGVWAEHSTEVAFFLEYDRGTEPHARLVGKLDDYATLAAATRDRFWVLFYFAGAKREAAARSALVHAGVRVATAVQGASPASAVWLPSGPAAGRVSLADLGRGR